MKKVQFVAVLAFVVLGVVPVLAADIGGMPHVVGILKKQQDKHKKKNRVYWADALEKITYFDKDKPANEFDKSSTKFGGFVRMVSRSALSAASIFYYTDKTGKVFIIGGLSVLAASGLAGAINVGLVEVPRYYAQMLAAGGFVLAGTAVAMRVARG